MPEKNILCIDFGTEQYKLIVIRILEDQEFHKINDFR